MTAQSSRIKSVNEQFLARIKPEFNSWGLTEHPNPASHFGRSSHGFRYDFADLTDVRNIKIAAFSILTPEPSLWIKGLRSQNPVWEATETPILFDSMKDLFTLTKSWSILRPLNVRLEYLAKSDTEPVDLVASRLIDDVIKELPKLRNYLYGKA